MSLDDFLVSEGILDGPVVERRRIGEGHSNITELVSDGSTTVVVRQPPPPPRPPGGHDMVREARIQRVLQDSAVPVPRILAVQEGEDPFYVMEHLDGVVVTTESPAGVDPRAIADELVDTLAALHRVEYTGDEFGRPYTDVERHLRRFASIIDGPSGEIGELLEWLITDPPAPREATIIHGDYRLGNVMLAHGEPRILAVFDWELATVGDPLRDVGYFLATYAVAEEPPHALTEMSAATLADGWPSRAQLADRYAAATGTEVPNIDWYTAMALWKLAVLFEYQSRRVAEGIGDDYYAQPGLVEGFLGAARSITGVHP